MNFKNILREIEKSDAEVYERLSGRRQVLKSFGSKVAVAALPLAIGSLFKKAYGKTADANGVVNALNLALEMEYFEYNFYHTANSLPDLIPPSSAYPSGNDKAGFLTIEAQEKAHILLLNTVITTLGGVPFTPKNYSATALNPLYVPSAYDFTGGGTYSSVFNDYPTFLIMAQVFEDTGIHAYQGQIPSLWSNTSVLGQAFQIQSTEGRHAAHVRLIRRQPPISAAENPAPWITNNIPPTVALQSYYVGEENTLQIGGTDISTLPDAYSSTGKVPLLSATAAFDEGMDTATILSLIQPFLL